MKYALTHGARHFAAASISDGVDGGYFQYLAAGGPANIGYMIGMEGVNGGLPWGAGRRMWQQRSPGSNVYKNTTPVRIIAENPTVALWEWEWFAALSRLRKPVEMVLMKDGEHVLQRPWERMISQQGNVDWFRFWLQHYEDPDAAKAEQYQRWRDLRKLQDVQDPERTKSDNGSLRVH